MLHVFGSVSQVVQTQQQQHQINGETKRRLSVIETAMIVGVLLNTMSLGLAFWQAHRREELLRQEMRPQRR